MEITKEIKEKIETMLYNKDKHDHNYRSSDCQYIRLGNSRLDFSKEYIFLGFTKKTVKLAWVNGRDLVLCQGKVENRESYYALFTEGWSFIEHLNKEVKA